MDLSKILTDASGATDELKYLGLGETQIQGFTQALEDQLSNLGPEDLSSFDEADLLGKLDLDSLAERIGVPSSMAGAAVQLVLPKLKQVLGGDAGAALSAASKLAGRFLKS